MQDIKKAVLVVEDDFLNRRLIKKVLEKSGYLVWEAISVDEAKKILISETIHLAILDISLGTGKWDGISLGEELKENNGTPFLYLTAYDTTAAISKALTTNPTTYLTKPFKNIDLLVAVELAMQRIAEKRDAQECLLVKDGAFYTSILIQDIDHIEAEGNYLKIACGDMQYSFRSSLKNIFNILPQNQFIQCHRAFLVNKERIEKFTKNSLQINDREIPVSKKYIINIQDIL